MDAASGTKSSGQSSAPSTLFFVEDGNTPGKGRSKQSRAHVARVNRQRQKLKSTDIAAATASQSTHVALTASSSSAPSTWTTQTTSRPTQAQARSQSDHHAVQVAGRRDRHSAAALMEARRTQSAPTVSQTIQPVFGGTEITSFSKEHSMEAAEVAKFCFERVLDSWLNPNFKPAWIAAFFQHPIVYHCLSFATGVMQDFTLSRPISSRRLWHRGMTISLVNSALGNLNDIDIEPVLLAITSLWRINTEILVERREVSVLFLPHVRNLSWVSVLGKLGGDPQHGQALAQLVHRKGGLHNFTTLPSLQESLALADLIDSSSRGTRPKFPSLWPAEHFLQALNPALQLLANDIEGRVFASNSLRLPDSCREVYRRLAAVDKMLDDFAQRTVSRAEDFWIGELSSAVQHDLLLLVPYTRLARTDREQTSQATYETCRMAASLYSNAVVFPVSPNDPWLQMHLKELRELLEVSSDSLHNQAPFPLLVWATFVASMAAFWTSHRMFFTNFLRDTLRRSGWTLWAQVEPLLKEFLWRDTACQHGATTLWKFLNVEQDRTVPIDC
ncbi:Putative fungal transcription factor [Septoria linicola]|uniref:Fungal transcription factor n=1 Tax=Septoria linicola TaxID=215465 RepID=A0A9Q9EKC4_9PEZI|nr:putative fungal transcription factor [Septoria linicola]USW52248.1 Putative fungal transcription factor [Septoria linicola]